MEGSHLAVRESVERVSSKGCAFVCNEIKRLRRACPHRGVRVRGTPSNFSHGDWRRGQKQRVLNEIIARLTARGITAANKRWKS